MIPVSSSTLDTQQALLDNSETVSWQKQMADALKSVGQLLEYLSINEKQLPYQLHHDSSFKLKVPKYFADLIEPGNPWDPILLQILPRSEEQNSPDSFSTDPLFEADYSPLPGLIHKYKNRVLLVAHQACALHCRYCFRQHFPYQEQRLDKAALLNGLKYIQSNSDINEVILSGGDPLSLSDKNLEELLLSLDELPQIDCIRIHTRTPVVLPDRITKLLLETFNRLQTPMVFVFHINHPQEITPRFCKVAEALKSLGITLLNQAVLLKDVNDKAETQVELCKDLFRVGILPYYLHSLDPIKGTHHFQISAEKAKKIWQEMQSELSGFLLPRLVQEIPNRKNKTWINPSE